jgi:cell wall-associated NlpC family hydrolase
MTAEDILAAARGCIGTPFRHQGRIAGQSLDCAGLVVHVAKTIGADYIDVQGYGRLPHKGLLESTLDAQPCLARVDDMRQGDVLLMRFGREPQHLAICAGETIIHSYQNAGKVCEHGLTGPWPARIVAIYRFKEIA